MSTSALSAIFKAYDVRGVVPEQLNEKRAYAIGAGFARFAADASGAHSVVMGRDMRTSGPSLAAAFAAGVESFGSTVTDVGLCSTDLLYFATGYLEKPGVMLTASHNPAQYNGIKFCLERARPIGADSGLVEIKRYAEETLAALGDGELPTAKSPERIDLLDEFAKHVRSFVDVDKLAPLKVIADTANGMGGLVAPRVFADLPFSFEILFGELDGSFPNHPADPIQLENLVSLRAAIVEEHADVGLAFDGDADRVFLVDDEGIPLSGSTTTAIVAQSMLAKNPGSTILYNCICSKTVPEVINEGGGIGVRTRVGHSFIKAVMAETGAVFGGEHSGHYYFRDNYGADSGTIAALIVLELLSSAGVSLSHLRKPFERYADSGEINTEVSDPAAIVAEVEGHYQSEGASIDHLDGLTADFGSWWFNLRPSNTEPLLRLNVEAADDASCIQRVDEVLAVVEKFDPGARRHGEGS